MKKLKIISLVLFLCITTFSIICLQINQTINVAASTYVDNSSSSFAGTYTNTQYDNTRLGIDVTNGNTSGTYLSDIKDSASTRTTWNSLSYTVDQPYGKELPISAGSDSGYTNNFSMASNYAYYRFNETNGATAFADSSGNVLNGSCGSVCPAFATSGFLNNILQLNNQGGQFGNLPVGFSVAKNQTKFSLAFWYKPTYTIAGSGTRSIFSESIGVTSTTSARLSVELNNGVLRLQGRNTDASALTTFATGTRVAVINTWYHGVITVDTTTATNNINLYISGVSEATSSLALSTFPNTSSSNTRAKIAQDTASANAAGTKFQGSMDELAFFQGRILTSTEAQQLYLRGAWRNYLLARSCSTSNCTGSTLVGPTGLTSDSGTFQESSSSNTGGNSQPTFTLSQTTFPPNQYFQYQISQKAYPGVDVVGTTNALIKSVTIDYTTGLANPSISFVIRNNQDTADANSCSFGNVDSSNLATCSYRLKVSTNATSGYSIFILTSSGLTSPDGYQISDAAVGSSGSGGNDISSSTVGIEKYGVVITAGSLTTGGSPVLQSTFNAGTNVVLYTYTVTPTKILQANAANSPGSTDTTNTVLITHKLNISGTTPTGLYSQITTYTVSPVF